MAAMLMETGIPYNKKKLHTGKKYFEDFLDTKAAAMPEALPGLLRLGRNVIEPRGRKWMSGSALQEPGCEAPKHVTPER